MLKAHAVTVRYRPDTAPTDRRATLTINASSSAEAMKFAEGWINERSDAPVRGITIRPIKGTEPFTRVAGIVSVVLG